MDPVFKRKESSLPISGSLPSTPSVLNPDFIILFERRPHPYSFDILTLLTYNYFLYTIEAKFNTLSLIDTAMSI